MSVQSSLQSVKNTVNRWLELDTDSVVDVALASYLAIKLVGDPLWIMLVAPPASAKTEIIRGLSECQHSYVISALTAQSLASGFVGKKGHDPSLIKKLSGKVLLFKDFTSVLSMRREARLEVLAQLREIYDGKFTKLFGNDKVLDWEGRVGFLGGVTPEIDRHYVVNQLLGERFLLFRLTSTNPHSVASQASQMVGQETQMRKEIAQAFKSHLELFNDSKNVTVPKIMPKILTKIQNLAILTATARTGIPRDRGDKHMLIGAEPEGPARLTKQLATLGVALGMVTGKNDVDEEIFWILRKVGKDSIPRTRLKIVEKMWEQGITNPHDREENTRTIGDVVDVPTTTAKYCLEDLMVLGLINRTVHKTEDLWRLSNFCCDLLSAIDGERLEFGEGEI